MLTSNTDTKCDGVSDGECVRNYVWNRECFCNCECDIICFCDSKWIFNCEWNRIR